MNKLSKIKQEIRTFLSFARFTKKEKDEVLEKITTIQKAQNCLDFLNDPEKYPKYNFGD